MSPSHRENLEALLLLCRGCVKVCTAFEGWLGATIVADTGTQQQSAKPMIATLHCPKQKHASFIIKKYALGVSMGLVGSSSADSDHVVL